MSVAGAVSVNGAASVDDVSVDGAVSVDDARSDGAKSDSVISVCYCM